MDVISVSRFLAWTQEQDEWPPEPGERVTRWVFGYQEALERDDNPMLMSLLHPRHYMDGRGQDVAKLLVPKHARGGVGIDIPIGVQCQVGHIVSGLDCRRVADQVDHRFPFSLGGANTPDNYVFLCEVCNQMKSTSVLHFGWDELPRWASVRLQQLHRLKTTG